MKLRITHILLILCAHLALSCESLPFSIFPEQSWYMDDYARNSPEIKGTFSLLGVAVDKSGARDSIQREAAEMAPLYFWQAGYCLENDSAKADYAAHVQMREREYIAGWQTKRSLSVEVRIYDIKDEDALRDAARIEHALPLTAGRATASGNKSFSSSDTAGRLLSAAIKRAVRGLDTGIPRRRR